MCGTLQSMYVSMEHFAYTAMWVDPRGATPTFLKQHWKFSVGILAGFGCIIVMGAILLWVPYCYGCSLLWSCSEVSNVYSDDRYNQTRLRHMYKLPEVGGLYFEFQIWWSFIDHQIFYCLLLELEPSKDSIRIQWLDYCMVCIFGLGPQFLLWSNFR